MNRTYKNSPDRDFGDGEERCLPTLMVGIKESINIVLKLNRLGFYKVYIILPTHTFFSVSLIRDPELTIVIFRFSTNK